MTDRELLELAAKAAGIFDLRFDAKGTAYRNVHIEWHPLQSDGDALRLAVKLGITVYPPETTEDHATATYLPNGWFHEPQGADPHAATRRAIVRAAAEIGRNMV